MRKRVLLKIRSFSSWPFKLAVRVNKSEEKVQKLTNKLNKHTMRIQQLEKEIGDLKLASVGLSAHH